MRAAAVIAAVMLSGCSASVPLGTSNDPDLMADVRAATSDTPALYVAATGSNVTWTVGTPPAVHFAAYTSWTCIWTACQFSVVVDPAYRTRATYRHEASHIACVSAWGDGTEECADREAAS